MVKQHKLQRNPYVLAMTLHAKGGRMRRRGERRPKDARRAREERGES